MYLTGTDSPTGAGNSVKIVLSPSEKASTL